MHFLSSLNNELQTYSYYSLMLPPNLKVCSPSYIYSFSPFSSFSYYLHPAPSHCSVWVDRLLSIHTSISSFPLIHTSIQPASHPTVYSSPVPKYKYSSTFYIAMVSLFPKIKISWTKDSFMICNFR